MHRLICSAYILQKIPAGKWLSCNVVLWGLVTACTASAKSFQGLIACRILLGVFEVRWLPIISPSLLNNCRLRSHLVLS